MSLSYQPADEELLGEPVLDMRRADPTPFYTYILVTAVVIVAISQLYAGLEISADRTAFIKPAFLHDREYWRILTGATVHGSVTHVAMNGFAFYSFGRVFETLTNRAHLPLVFLFSAIAGGVLSLIFAPEGSSVGASGGIVGLIGYLAVYAFKRRQFITPEFRRSLLINIGFILLFGLALYQVIDNYAHIGGLVAGAAYGLIQISGDQYSDPLHARGLVQLAGLLALAVYLAACFFSVLLIAGIV